MKALFAIFLFAAAVLLQLSDAVLCPVGEISDDKTKLTKKPKECEFCVEYRCGQQKEQYGCQNDAFEDCPKYQDSSLKNEGVNRGYCRTTSEGEFFYYFPSCKGESDYWECKEKREFKISYLTFKEDCKNDQIGTASFPWIKHSSDGTICPRVPLGGKSILPVVCEECAMYRCKEGKDMLTGRGCISNFVHDCWDVSRDEVIKIKDDKNQSRMFYCSDKVEFWTGCKGEEDWDKCMAEGMSMNKTLQREAEKCDGRKPGDAPLFGTLPQETTTVQASKPNPDASNSDVAADGKSDASKTTAIESLWFFGVAAAALWFLLL